VLRNTHAPLNFFGHAFHGGALRPFESAHASSRGFRKRIEGFREEIVHILEAAALDAFPNPAFEFRLLNLDTHESVPPFHRNNARMVRSV
jgi:hypothetical protein